MSNISFNQEINFEYYKVIEVAPQLRRIVAPNPGSMTFKGTNTYIIGEGKVAIVDPGPDVVEHQEAILKILENEEITHIILTHTHIDHSEGVDALKKATGAKTVGHDGRHKPRREGPQKGDGQNFIDWAYLPDITIDDGEILEVGNYPIEAVYTPGHAPDHICLALKEQEVLISGDHVMAWNTSVIAPPEGHMGDYLSSLQKILERNEKVFFPGHGGRILDPMKVTKAYLVHRMLREGSIFNCVKDGLSTIAQIRPRVYPEISASLHAACALSLLAHLEFLVERGLLISSEQGRPSLSASFQLP